MSRSKVYNFGDNLSVHEDNRLTFLFENVEGRSVRSDGQKEPRRGFFLCECGTVVECRIGSVTSKKRVTLSCGCLGEDIAGDASRTHGLTKHSLYDTYMDMMRRCYDERRSDYKHYGGRGIEVCGRWRNKENGLKNFIEDLVSKPEGLELDRINVNGDYTYENTKWSERSDQCFNRRKGSFNKSGVVGVYWHTQSSRWRVQISHRGEKIGLGNHRNFEDAVKVRKEAELKYFGYNPENE